MRVLVWFTLGFAGACALGAYAFQEGLLLCGALCVLLGAAMWFAGRKSIPLRRSAGLLLGCAAGFAWFFLFQSVYLHPACSLDGKNESCVIRASDYSYETAYGYAVDGWIDIDGKTYRVRAYLDDTQQVEPGDALSGRFRFRITVPGGAEEATYHQGKGIFLLAYQMDETARLQSQEGALRNLPAKLRHRILERLNRSFPEDTAPFARALLLGDTSGLDYETDTALKLTGIRHVVAVSGLHISIVFAILSGITLKKRYLTALLGVPALLLFAGAAGFTPSVTRACVMSGMLLLASLLEKEYDGPTALAAASLVMLVRNPLVITAIGFQLSVCSVAGIFLFSPAIRKWISDRLEKGKGKKKRLVRWLSGSLSVSLGAQLLTTPLCAWYFGTVSLLGPLTNLLVLWIIPILFVGMIAVCLTGFAWQTGGAMLAGLLSVPIRLLLGFVKALARFPLAAVYTRSVYIAAWVVFVYVLLVLFWLGRSKRPVILACCAGIGLCAALLASWLEPLTAETSLTVLNVGQGQCLILQSEGRTFLVDCGGDSDKKTADMAAETLISRGIRRLDGILLTHCDRDHAGAVENLLCRVDTDLLVLPEASELASRTSGSVLYAAQDLQLAFGDTKITVYAPTFPGNSNENSLCILFDTKKCDILITGDRNGFGERMLLRNAEIPKVDVLIAGHHGSRNSTCEQLLQAAQPEIVCISVGRDNPYGHPAPELLNRLAEYGCTVFRTDQNGDILIRRGTHGEKTARGE